MPRLDVYVESTAMSAVESRAIAAKHSTSQGDGSGADSTPIAVWPTDPDEQPSVLVTALIAKGERAKAMAMLAATTNRKRSPRMSSTQRGAALAADAGRGLPVGLVTLGSQWRSQGGTPCPRS